MQYVAKATLPWLRVKPHAVFALGGSMGGQETLLLVAGHGGCWARPTGLRPISPYATGTSDSGRHIAGAGAPRARRHTGCHPGAYARCGLLIAHTRAIAFSQVPLQLYWSVADEVVLTAVPPSGCSANLRAQPRSASSLPSRLWTHSDGMPLLLPRALRGFGPLPAGDA